MQITVANARECRWLQPQSVITQSNIIYLGRYSYFGITQISMNNKKMVEVVEQFQGRPRRLLVAIIKNRRAHSVYSVDMRYI